MNIQSVVCTSQQQPIYYRVGNKINGTIIDKIQINLIRINGDPYEHYCGFDNNENMLFSINCLSTCEVTYGQ